MARALNSGSNMGWRSRVLARTGHSGGLSGVNPPRGARRPCAGDWRLGVRPALADSRIAHTLTVAINGVKMSVDTNRNIDNHVGSRVRMRRMMLSMSQESLGNAIGVTFQQVQKYEKGTNRISASRLQHISQILQVPVPFFFEGAPGGAAGTAETPSYVREFLASSDGLALMKAFTRIKNARLRRLIVALVEDCAEL
jgi:transcriptional regulator with XRE-family HTH domain